MTWVFFLYLIQLWTCFGSCVHKVFPHLSHSKTCQNRVCRTSASHWGWPCFWSTYLTSWSNGVPMRFDTILLNWSTLTVRSSILNSWHFSAFHWGNIAKMLRLSMCDPPGCPGNLPAKVDVPGKKLLGLAWTLWVWVLQHFLEVLLGNLWKSLEYLFGGNILVSGTCSAAHEMPMRPDQVYFLDQCNLHDTFCTRNMSTRCSEYVNSCQHDATCWCYAWVNFKR